MTSEKTLIRRERRKAIRAVFETWTDHEAKRALEWVENDRPIIFGSVKVHLHILSEGAL